MRFKGTLVAIVASAFVLPLLFLAMPFLELFNDMAVQPKAKAQGHYGWFSDEQRIVEQPPVPGTIPDDYEPYPITGKDAQAARLAGEQLTNPLTSTMDALKRGQTVFNNICIVCHGEHGKGDGRIQGPDLFPAPPSLHTEQARAFPDGRIFHVITRGQNKMPPYADVLRPVDRWSVVHYVRALQRAGQKRSGN